MSSGKILYTPGPEFNLLTLGQSATETFSYVMRDSAGALCTASVVVTVNGAANGGTITSVKGGDVTGTTADEQVLAGNGGNVIHGLGGADTIAGGDAADAILGDAGFNFLRGGNGGDTLKGGLGNDTLQGDNGPDRFVFDGTNFGHDVILDFSQGDNIQLSKSAFADFAAFKAHAIVL